MSSHSPIPVIDFHDAVDGAPGALRRLADEVFTACTQSGFFTIVNHSIDPLLIDETFKEAGAFFALPEPDKLAVSMENSVNYRGYIPFKAPLYKQNRRGNAGKGFQLHLSDERLDNTPPDDSESFQIHQELPADDPDVGAGKPLHGPNQWPANRISMRGTLTAYYEAASAFAHLVLRVFALGLEVDEHFFERYYRKPLMQLRLMHYPCHDPAGNVPFGVRPHSDAGAFTMLVQDDVGGLEVQSADGTWRLVPPIKHALVVNIGDTMKLWTNNRFRSTPHRVINTHGADRISIPFFANPDYDAVIEPIKTCVDQDHPPVFDVLHCGESMLHTYSRIWPSAAVIG